MDQILVLFFWFLAKKLDQNSSLIMVVLYVLLKCRPIFANFAALVTLVIGDLVHISHVIGEKHLVVELFSTCVTTVFFLVFMNHLHVFLQPFERVAANVAKIFCCTVLMVLGHVLVQFLLIRE